MEKAIKRINLRLPDELHAEVKKAAANDDRSIHSWLLAAIRRASKEASGKQPASAG